MIDHLKDHAARSLEDYQCPSLETQLKNKNSRYKAMSAMQKAIRFGDVDSAQRAGHALVSSGFAGPCSAT
jgi:replication-associated recombination protein RarA